MRILLAAAMIAGSLTAPVWAQALPQGVWEAKDYGVVIASDDRVTMYEVSAAGCVKGDRLRPADFAVYIGVPEAVTADSAVLVHYPTRTNLKRLADLPPACRKPLATSDKAPNLAVFAETFAANYPFFAERGVDWAALKSKAGQEGDLFAALSGMAAALKDGHVTIDNGDKTFAYNPVAAPGKAPDGSDWTPAKFAASLRDYLQTERFAGKASIVANRKVLHGKLPDGIGYIAILGEAKWSGGIDNAPEAEHVAAADAEMDRILAEYAGARGLIIDLRINTGGYDAVALAIASRFADQEHLAFRKAAGRSAPYDVTVKPSTRTRFLGPVAVIIGRNTVSAGETLAQSMRALPQVRLFGQPTQGILSDAIPKHLPNGWEFTMSIERYATPDGVLIEVKGVQPHETTTPPAEATPAAQWGRDIDTAAAWIKSRP